MSSPRLSLRASSLAVTHGVAAAVARVVRSGDVILLSGEMGAGKTAFAQGFGRALGVEEPITSPTFTLVHSYATPSVTLHHADLYRLEHLAEVADLALGELAEYDGVVLVEWGDVVESIFGDHLLVRLETDDVDDADDADDVDDGADDATPDVADDELASGRVLSITGYGRSWALRWGALTQSLREVAGAEPC